MKQKRNAMGENMDYLTLFQCNKQIEKQLAICVSAFRRQNYDRGIRVFQTLLTLIQKQIQIILTHGEALQQDGIQVDSQYLLQLLSDLMGAQEQEDYILLPDLLELTISPFCIQLQTRIQEIVDGRAAKETSGDELSRGYLINQCNPDFWEKNISLLHEMDSVLADRLEQHARELRVIREDAGIGFHTPGGKSYYLEETQSGYLTMRVQDENQKSFYLHSNSNVITEAMNFAENYVSETAMSYHILGMGLGYHCEAVAEQSLCARKVHVYETDGNVLVISLHLFDWSGALQNWLVLHEDPELLQLSRAIGQEVEGFIIHHPSMRNIESLKLRRTFEKYFITENSFRNQRKQLLINFQRNDLKRKAGEISELGLIIEQMRHKKVIIVAAGPSLDKNVWQLKNMESRDHIFMLATGTVFYKLLQMGIRPDAVIITDSNQRVLYQIRQHEQETIPMLLLSTACYGFAERYQGDKYLIYQKDFPPAETTAAECDFQTYETGGSVSTTALDVAIRAGADTVIFVGLDLAFTDHLAHASGTSNQMTADTQRLIPVRAYGGGTVLSDQKFIIYREWMERRLQEADGKAVRVINATEGGCYLEGAVHRTLQDALGDSL
ncbi:MAG: DUF115 domain-containing protein [Lachnospiraceae bacterium]|nr:DUF115 domain-containing protein [Lachnospiraceae bacterium]